MDGVGGGGDVVRVDEEGRLQLLGGAGELGEHEHAGVVGGLGGDELLGDEVHPVVERRDEADAGQAVEAAERAAVIAAGEVADGHPVEVGIVGVDASGEAVEFLAQHLVGVDRLARGRGDLQEADAAAQLLVVVEHAAEGLHALRQALGIVHAVDADDQRAVVDDLAEAGGGVAALLALGLGGDFVGVDADREGLGAYGLVESLNPPVVQDHAACDIREIAAEVGGVALGLEADEVEGAEAARQPLVLRERGEDLGRRKRGVQEEAHAPLPAGLAHLLPHEQEVVVVHPDGVVLAGELGEQAREAAVDLLVGGELGLVEMREVDAVVEDRPEGAVGVAEIVAFVFRLGEVREGEVDVALGEEAHAAGLALHRLAGPAEPDAAAFGECVAEGHGQATCAQLARGGHAIGCDDQPSRHRRSAPSLPPE